MGERGHEVFEAQAGATARTVRGADGAAGREGGEWTMSTRRPLLLPLAPLYGAALALKRQMFRLGVVEAEAAGQPGDQRGQRVGGRRGKDAGGDDAGEDAAAARVCGDDSDARVWARSEDGGAGGAVRRSRRWYGDEPVLLAQRSGVPVFVGADRYSAGLLAEQSERCGKDRCASAGRWLSAPAAGARCRYCAADAGGRGGHAAAGGQSARAAGGAGARLT